VVESKDSGDGLTQFRLPNGLQQVRGDSQLLPGSRIFRPGVIPAMNPATIPASGPGFGLAFGGFVRLMQSRPSWASAYPSKPTCTGFRPHLPRIAQSTPLRHALLSWLSSGISGPPHPARLSQAGQDNNLAPLIRIVDEQGLNGFLFLVEERSIEEDSLTRRFFIARGKFSVSRFNIGDFRDHHFEMLKHLLGMLHPAFAEAFRLR
jgi:hypothetical protein